MLALSYWVHCKLAKGVAVIIPIAYAYISDHELGLKVNPGHPSSLDLVVCRSNSKSGPFII